MEPSSVGPSALSSAPAGPSPPPLVLPQPLALDRPGPFLGSMGCVITTHLPPPPPRWCPARHAGVLPARATWASWVSDPVQPGGLVDVLAGPCGQRGRGAPPAAGQFASVPHAPSAGSVAALQPQPLSSVERCPGSGKSSSCVQLVKTVNVGLACQSKRQR